MRKRNTRLQYTKVFKVFRESSYGECGRIGRDKGIGCGGAREREGGGGEERTTVLTYSQAHVNSISEHAVCQYRVILGVPEVCGHPQFSGVFHKPETWVLELTEVCCERKRGVLWKRKKERWKLREGGKEVKYVDVNPLPHNFLGKTHSLKDYKMINVTKCKKKKYHCILYAPLSLIFILNTD